MNEEITTTPPLLPVMNEYVCQKDKHGLELTVISMLIQAARKGTKPDQIPAEELEANLAHNIKMVIVHGFQSIKSQFTVLEYMWPHEFFDDYYDQINSIATTRAHAGIHNLQPIGDIKEYFCCFAFEEVVRGFIAYYNKQHPYNARFTDMI